ncbi:MAG TPA: ABC transporter permease [Gaiellaceae bacterium]|jgi:peptide/nickel transport system permease protein
MGRYAFVGRRVLQMIPVLIGITIITFFLLRLIPGDPALAILGDRYTPERGAELRQSLGLQKPVWDQYVLFMQHLFHGNLGESISFREPARTVIADRLPATLFLVAYAAVLAAVLSIPAGVVSALRRGRAVDQTVRVTSLVGFAMPPFWLGIMFILVFAVKVPVFPVNGYGNGFVDHLYYLFLPALTIAVAFSTILIRTLRASTLSALNSEYVDTARIKGISRFSVLRRHVFRNAVVSIVVVYGINLAFLISGTVIVEEVFAVPGLGRLLIDSVDTRDYPVVQGVTLVFAFLIVFVNLLTDVVHAALDPRVTVE